MNNILVVGCARSGYWVSKLLNKNGYQVTLTDARAIKEKAELESLGIVVYDNGHPDILKNNGYVFVVKNPGIPYSNDLIKYFVDNRVPVYTEIEIALMFDNSFEIGAITGTNGKTTITTLLNEILNKEFTCYAGGNIGTALSELVYNGHDYGTKLALEISAFQLLGAPSFRPNVAVITNLSPDHLDYFNSLDDYYGAKNLIYQNMADDDWFLLNIDDENVMNYFKGSNCRVVTYSLEKRADLYFDGTSVYLFDKRLFDRFQLKIIGLHNLQNAMIACAMAYKLGASLGAIEEVVSNFRGVEHRIEFVEEIDGVKYYNDSKGTNTDSTVVALKSFDRPVILLAGGHDKHTGFKELCAYSDKIKKLITFGETKYELAKLKDDSIVCDDMAQALGVARSLAVRGDVILLSPACSSYDQFDNFEQRGNIFKELVRNR